MKLKTYSVQTCVPATSCHCVGAQTGQPYCPCEMRQRGIFMRDGRWVEPARKERDLGPAHPASMFDTSGGGTGCIDGNNVQNALRGWTT